MHMVGFSVLSLLGLGIVCLTVIILRILSFKKPQAGTASADDDDDCLLREMHQTLLRMEHRVETLETLLHQPRPNAASSGADQSPVDLGQRTHSHRQEPV